MNVLDWSIPYHRHFEEMTRIPHGSYHEKAYSDYLVSFAKKLGLRWKQYDAGSVIIYKPASPGYEEHPPVILQAHIDMVCEKAPGSLHDFDRDPLELYIQDGFLRARDTTLGADDGAGVAYILSILEDDSLPHPPLECIFTVQEEVTSVGVEVLDPADITARRMIGLDDGGGTTTFVSSAGGVSVELERLLSWEKADMPGYTLRLSGLSGGHSGPCISEEKGNAIKLAVRVLCHLYTELGIRLSSLQGGSAANVIPGECAAVFASDAPPAELEKIVSEQLNAIRKELESSDPDISIVLTPCDAADVLSTGETWEVLSFLRLLPNGFRHKSMEIDGLTVASENLGVIRTGNGRLSTESHLRGALESYLDELLVEYQLLSERYGFRMREDDRYPAWAFDAASPIRKLMMEVYTEITGGEIRPIAVHGGLECGYFKGKFPDMDIVTVGPTTLNMHTTEESLDLKSFDDIYRVVTTMLARL